MTSKTTNRTRVSTRSVVPPVRDFLGTMRGSTRTKRSSIEVRSRPRTKPSARALGLTLLASSSSNWTRTRSGPCTPSWTRGFSFRVDSANSPGRISTWRTKPPTGARTTNRSRSTCTCSTHWFVPVRHPLGRRRIYAPFVLLRLTPASRSAISLYSKHLRCV